MTAQMHDSILWNDQKFSIVGGYGSKLFHSSDFNVHPVHKIFFLTRSSFFSFPLPAPLPSFHIPLLSPLLMELSRSMKFLPAVAGKGPASVCVWERRSRSSFFRVKSRMEKRLSGDLAELVGHVRRWTAVSPCPLNSVTP